jgi:hypothetical protein
LHAALAASEERTMKLFLATVARLIGFVLLALLYWYLLSAIYNLLLPLLHMQQASIGIWGREKSLSNLAIETPLVIAIGLICGVAAAPWKETRWFKRAAMIALPLIFAVVLLVPGFTE